MSANLENSALATGKDWKKLVFILIPKKGNARERAIALISHGSKVMLKILQARASAICEP